jgi:hypothetical protein
MHELKCHLKSPEGVQLTHSNNFSKKINMEEEKS